MAEEVKSADAPVQQPAKGPFVHSLRVYLVGGQQFTLNEVTDSRGTSSPLSTPGAPRRTSGTAPTTTCISASA